MRPRTDQVCDEDPTFDPGPENARKNRGLALAIGFGAGALGALTAATIGIALAADDDTPAVSLQPSVGPEGGMLTVRGSF